VTKGEKMNQTNEEILPWYRQFWFWFIFGPLIFIVVLCCFTVSLAYHYSDDVVTDSYYKTGVMINQKFQQDEKAAALGLNARIKFDTTTREILLSLKGNGPLPKQLTLFLDNPVKSAKDQSVLLQEIGLGEYRGELPAALEYSWYLALVPGSDANMRKQAEWLLSGDINLAKASETLLQSRVK
jgi:hypothetical protein